MPALIYGRHDDHRAVIALSLGIGAAIYLYTQSAATALRQLVRITTETSGHSVHRTACSAICVIDGKHWGYSLLAGAFTVAIMICHHVHNGGGAHLGASLP